MYTQNVIRTHRHTRTNTRTQRETGVMISGKSAKADLPKIMKSLENCHDLLVQDRDQCQDICSSGKPVQD